jgi:two-component system OmpR family sensor kinase
MVRVEKMKNRIPFSQRLFWSIFVMFLGFTVCFLLFQYQREREFSQEKLNNVLSNYNYQLFSRTQQEGDIDKTVQQFIEEIPQKELRVTIIDPEGKVLFDNSGTEEFNNHNDRSEVRKARLYNEGFAIRTSGSTGRRYFYSASNIGSYIYRSALPYDPYVQSALSTDKDFIYFMILMTLIFFFVLSRFTFSIGRTISKLRDFALNIEKDRIPETDYTFPNDELGDISKNIVTLYHQQQKAKDELSMEREKLIKHFQYAKEGFAMFTPEGKEILSNILLIQFSNVISDNQIRQAEEVIDIQELEPIKAFLNKNIPNTNRKRKVLRDSVTIDKNGKIFLIECILFLDNSYEISINDISRQEEESRMKRQLTQNVAHELKTPVSSIQDNAIAYAGEGSQIIVNCYKEDPKFYYFSFADNGVGISEEHINRIFERFYRVDKGRSRKVGGTGLGLSIVKNGVNFHKGQISAKSSPGKGVTFFFTLKKKL